VHRSDCPNILRLEADKRDRLIEARWGYADEGVVPATIRIIAYDRTGLLRDITAVLGNETINVLGVTSATHPRSRIAEIEIRLESHGIEELSRVLGKIGELANVREVQRIA
jgi:GTP pyrophosphokinase